MINYTLVEDNADNVGTFCLVSATYNGDVEIGYKLMIELTVTSLMQSISGTCVHTK
jgi:hypothetical protein